MATASTSANTECTESCGGTDSGLSSGDVTKTGELAVLPHSEGDSMADQVRPDASPSPHLTMEEEAATKKFLENVNKWRSARQLEEVNIHILRSLHH